MSKIINLSLENIRVMTEEDQALIVTSGLVGRKLQADKLKELVSEASYVAMVAPKTETKLTRLEELEGLDKAELIQLIVSLEAGGTEEKAKVFCLEQLQALGIANDLPEEMAEALVVSTTAHGNCHLGWEKAFYTAKSQNRQKLRTYLRMWEAIAHLDDVKAKVVADGVVFKI